MALVTKTKTWADLDNVNYTDINANFDTLYTEINGNLDNDNIDAAAGIAPTKIDGTAATLAGTQTFTGTKTFNAIVLRDFGGWIEANETWTYGSADDPTFTLTISGDKTTKYTVGMRVKLTQTSDKFFIITKVAYSSPNTTLTLYGGTDYDLANAAITSPFYSSGKAPQGFPLDPSKWTVEVVNTSSNTQSSPVNGTWYNVGSISLVIPIGVWDLSFQALGSIATSAGIGQLGVFVALSTTNNGATDSDMIATYTQQLASTDLRNVEVTAYRRKTLALTSKTTYYLNAKADVSASSQTLELSGDVVQISVRAICAYL
jgi:hypothetical protein